MTTDAPTPITLGEFLDDAQGLLVKAQECLSHLELIQNDPDATECMIRSLDKLANRAMAAAQADIGEFCREIRDLLRLAQPRDGLHDSALRALGHCLTLLAWQLELIDIRTGRLGLDTEEQANLVESLAETLRLSLSRWSTARKDSAIRPDSCH